MTAVHLEPLGVDIDVQPGEALIEAAWRLGYHWPTTCWGQAQCMLCRVHVTDGVEAAEPASAEELEAMQTWLPAAAKGEDVRLACRLRVIGEGLTLRKAGVRRPGPAAV